MSENNQINKAPAQSMLDVVRAAYHPCGNGAHCIPRCEYYYFCDALKRAYHEVQHACDHNSQLRAFIVNAMNDEEDDNNG